jgi:uncharacterized protein YjiS (DUF1127 family)
MSFARTITDRVFSPPRGDMRRVKALTPPNRVLHQRPIRARAWLPASGATLWLATWLDRAERRNELANLSADQLRDAGLDQRTVAREARKPFWIA